MQSHAPTRRYPRVKAPKGLLIAWRATGRHTLSHAETVGLGGLFLYTHKPLAKGSMVDLIIDAHAEGIRARGIVRYILEGTGMGLEFVHMLPEDRMRLNRFLKAQESEPSQLVGSLSNCR